MYAIIKTSGKQYKIEAGTVFDVDRVAANVGDVIDLKDFRQYIQDPVLFRHAGLGSICSDRHRRANKGMAFFAVAGACLLSGCRDFVSDQK